MHYFCTTLFYNENVATQNTLCCDITSCHFNYKMTIPFYCVCEIVRIFVFTSHRIRKGSYLTLFYTGDFVHIDEKEDCL